MLKVTETREQDLSAWHVIIHRRNYDHLLEAQGYNQVLIVACALRDFFLIWFFVVVWLLFVCLFVCLFVGGATAFSMQHDRFGSRPSYGFFVTRSIEETKQCHLPSNAVVAQQTLWIENWAAYGLITDTWIKSWTVKLNYKHFKFIVE